MVHNHLIHANVKVDHKMIRITLQYERFTLPESVRVEEHFIMKYLVMYSLNTQLESITLQQDDVLIHLGELEVSNLRTHARRLMSNGATVPILGSSLRKEAASA